jgi:acyl-CoA dehydrogenase
MNFDHSSKVKELMAKLTVFMDQEIYPLEEKYHDLVANNSDRWQTPELMEELKAKAKSQGLWNLFRICAFMRNNGTCAMEF